MDRDRQRIEVHHKVGRSIQINPKPCLLQLVEQPQVDVQPKEANSELDSETGAVIKICPLPEVFRKVVPPRGGRGGPAQGNGWPGTNRPKASRAAVKTSMLEPNIMAVRRPFTAPQSCVEHASGSGDGARQPIHLQPCPAQGCRRHRAPQECLQSPNHVAGSTPRSNPLIHSAHASSMRSSVDIKLEMATTVEQDSGTMATASIGEVSQHRSTT